VVPAVEVEIVEAVEETAKAVEAEDAMITETGLKAEATNHMEKNVPVVAAIKTAEGTGRRSKIRT